ncbi:hypothetical protein LIER_00689 [Lithospermum erythrorhizon]|uniref:Uncharacterized protein n=1 Tax=Lithospermum erythrorhizon TaxID=34254 RepID=A0AAV3NJ13_LITER
MPHLPSGSLPGDGTDSGPKALNASHSLDRRSDALDNARVEACEEERALRLQTSPKDFSKRKAEDTAQKLKAVEEAVPGQIAEEIRGYHFSEGFRKEAGKDVGYCLCRLAKLTRR